MSKQSKLLTPDDILIKKNIKKRHTNKTEMVIYFCPISDCNKDCLNKKGVRQHLVNSHKMNWLQTEQFIKKTNWKKIIKQTISMVGK